MRGERMEAHFGRLNFAWSREAFSPKAHN